MTLNERLGYFGQTVKLAARVQGPAEENEIYLTEEMYGLPFARPTPKAPRGTSDLRGKSGSVRD